VDVFFMAHPVFYCRYRQQAMFELLRDKYIINFSDTTKIIYTVYQHLGFYFGCI